ncbi:MAG: transposase [Actinomycetota bacterium]|nr:transposase [Actinomycetota bacterium]
MLRGETTKRSPLDAEAVVAALQAQGVEQLREEPSVWVIIDGSDLRKPHAAEMAHLQRVKRLDSPGTVPGYPTLNVLGIGPQRRGLPYHKLYSSTAPDFVRAPREVQAALASVGTALAPQVAAGTEGTAILDSGFDDQAVWATVWGQGWHLVCRLCHRDRLVRVASGAPLQPLADLAPRLRERARVEAELVVQKHGQPRPKRQPVTVVVAATPAVVPYHVRTAAAAEQEQACWLVEVRLERVAAEPWWLLTDRPVETAEQATEVFPRYCQRWSIEDAFKVAKTCLGWEDVQVMSYEALRLLVALGWVAAGFLFALGVTLEWPEVRLLQRLGGGEARPNRPPGQQVLTRGLRRLFDLLATEAILADEERRYGGLPLRIAALLGRPAATH